MPFLTVLFTHINHTTVKNNDIEEILNLLELVVGVAVMCEDKNVFIPKIFELNELSQVNLLTRCVYYLLTPGCLVRASLVPAS